MGTESHGRLAKTSSGLHTAGPEDKPVLKLRDPKYKTSMECQINSGAQSRGVGLARPNKLRLASCVHVVALAAGLQNMSFFLYVSSYPVSLPSHAEGSMRAIPGKPLCSPWILMSQNSWKRLFTSNPGSHTE